MCNCKIVKHMYHVRPILARYTMFPHHLLRVNFFSFSYINISSLFVASKQKFSYIKIIILYYMCICVSLFYFFIEISSTHNYNYSNQSYHPNVVGYLSFSVVLTKYFFVFTFKKDFLINSY